MDLFLQRVKPQLCPHSAGSAGDTVAPGTWLAHGLSVSSHVSILIPLASARYPEPDFLLGTAGALPIRLSRARLPRGACRSEKVLVCTLHSVSSWSDDCSQHYLHTYMEVHVHVLFL